MSQIDRELCGIIGCAIAVVGLIVGGVHYMAHRTAPEIEEFTESYYMPPELSGCRVYRLAPKGHGPVLYVVADGERPVAPAWTEKSGKISRSVLVETP